MSNKLGKRKRRLLEEGVNEKEFIKPFNIGWYKQYSKYDRETFEYNCIILVTGVLTILWAIFDYNFPGVHHLLSFFCLIIFLILVLRRNDLSILLTNSRNVFANIKDSTLHEMTDAVLISNAALALISILFIINLEIFAHAGVRIGAAAAFGLFSLVKHVLNSFRNNN